MNNIPVEELKSQIKKLRQKNGVFDSFEEWFETQRVNYKFDDKNFDEGIKDLLKQGWKARDNEVDGLKYKFSSLCQQVGAKEIADGVVTLDFWKSEQGIVFKTLFKVIGVFLLVLVLYSSGII